MSRSRSVKKYTCRGCEKGGFKSAGNVAAHRQRGECPGTATKSLPQTKHTAMKPVAAPSCKFCPNCGIDLRKVKVAA